MILKDISFASPQENILCDEMLFFLAEKKGGPEVLRFWESPDPFVVLGRIGKADKDVKAEAVRRDKIPVLRRSSGGGTVLQGKGCLNFTLVVRKDRDSRMNDLRDSYRYLLEFVRQSLSRQGVESVFQPISDLALKNPPKKFSGNAQRRGRNTVLHHGTILYNFDLPLIERYLLLPEDQPEYRQNRKHLDFITNIPLDPAKFKSSLAESLGVSEQTDQLTLLEREQLKEFLQEKNITVF